MQFTITASNIGNARHLLSLRLRFSQVFIWFKVKKYLKTAKVWTKYSVWACLNSQHSKWKINKFLSKDYPDLERYISTFYGNYFDSPKDFNLTMFDSLNLETMYITTKPELVVLRVTKFISFKKSHKFSVNLIWKDVLSRKKCLLDMVGVTIILSIMSENGWKIFLWYESYINYYWF